ncbi:hypothetical protein MMAD_19100 [Mycolicibacterium madagascariense]|uniref:Fimbrial assembly protein FimA n=1 Tax=Mycolicibacterium madagascariense TaxID=212765 RepID=A0A7I7XDU8_9MYCO|nr:DUF1028 domain-containing protein [Mycolicibacterium madagascariense]MCV7015320.1 DUF1028 domain-containing protein [Mycolicibacterium madagascariense]BBZ27615.1 hypothetical protein MMAD_19100 [Mycolicibacterium madagascariense]
MTFSLVARDGSGAFGIVISSSSPAVAARCAHLRTGVGAVCSQNVTNPQLGVVALDALADGRDAAGALATTLASEPHRDHRQVVIVDGRGGTAVHTGTHALGINHHAQTTGAAAAGNMLRDAAVVEALLAGYVDSAAATLEARLLDGLVAAAAAGGEAGPVRSAGLQVVEDVPWPVTDLRVDWHDDPVTELRRLWDVWEPQKRDYRTRGLDPTVAPSYGVPGDP